MLIDLYPDWKNGNINQEKYLMLKQNTMKDEISVREGGNITVKFKFNDAYKEAMEYSEVNKEIIKTA